MNHFVLVFFTHGAAIRISRELRGKGESLELSPTPRELSSSCGVVGYLDTVKPWAVYIDDEHIERIYRVEQSMRNDEVYELLYEAEGL